MDINDLINRRELQGFVRNIPLDTFSLRTYLPDDFVDDISWRAIKGRLADQDAAEFRAWDTEAPLGNRQGTSRISGELPPISKKMTLGEEERLRKRMINGSDVPYIDAIYNDVGNLRRAIEGRIEVARGQAIWDGKTTINENGMVVEIDYGMPSNHKVAPATVWSNHAEAKVIANLSTWKQRYIDTNGVEPGFMLTSNRVVLELMQVAEFRTLLSTLQGAPGLITRQALNDTLAAYDLPNIVVNDEKVRVNGTPTRVIPDTKVVFLPAEGEDRQAHGRTFWGETAEALALVNEGILRTDEAPGIVAEVWEDNDPLRTWTRVTGVGLPVIVNPELALTATVL